MIGSFAVQRFAARSLVFVSLSLSVVALAGCGSSSGSLPVAGATRTYTEKFPLLRSSNASYWLAAAIQPDSPVQVAYALSDGTPQVLQENVDYALNRQTHSFRLLRALATDAIGSPSLMVQYQPVL